jgi:hypothetical protein
MPYCHSPQKVFLSRKKQHMQHYSFFTTVPWHVYLLRGGKRITTMGIIIGNDDDAASPRNYVTSITISQPEANCPRGITEWNLALICSKTLVTTTMGERLCLHSARAR